MFFWYIGLSVLGVATIFRSVGVDYRLDRARVDAAAARRPPVRVPRVRLHAAVRGGAARRRDGRHHRSAPAAASAPVVPADRRVLRARAVGRVHQQRAVLVAVPRDVVRARRAAAVDRRGGRRGADRPGRVLGASWASTTSTCPARVDSSSAPAASPPAPPTPDQPLRNCVSARYPRSPTQFRGLALQPAGRVSRPARGWWCGPAWPGGRGRRPRRSRSDLRPGRRPPACPARRATRGLRRRCGRRW